MSTSHEKLELALDRVENVAEADDAPGQLKAAAAMVTMGRGTLERLLPSDTAQLDELLTRGAEWLLSLRSDPPTDA